MEVGKKFIFLTGVAGFIGSHLAEALIQKGYSLIGIDNFDGFYNRKQKENNLLQVLEASKKMGVPFFFFEKDILRLQAADFKNFEIDSVIHLAGKAGVRLSLQEPIRYDSVNIQGTLTVLEFCKERKIKNFILGSSSSVYGDSTPVPFQEDASCDQPLSPYAVSKRAAEFYAAAYARLYGISTAVLRFFTVYGPRQRPDMAIHLFAKLITASQPLTVFNLKETSRDYTFVSDIVDGILAALLWTQKAVSGHFEIFNLGGARPIGLLQIIRALETNLGIPAKIVEAPQQEGEVLMTRADLVKSQRMLSYVPKVSIETGLALFADWYLKQKKDREE